MGKGRKDVPINALVMGTLRFAHPTQNGYVIFFQVPHNGHPDSPATALEPHHISVHGADAPKG